LRDMSTFRGHTKPKAVLAEAVRLGRTAAELASEAYSADPPVPAPLLGACLGGHDPFWRLMAEEFPLCFRREFKGGDVVTALRRYLWQFRLPGESAQIERIIEGFAAAYFQFNFPGDGPASLVEVPGVDSGVSGWYTSQPRPALTGKTSVPVCCAHCGALAGSARGEVLACRGCSIVHFCRPCRKLASRRGHAVVGAIGFGRGCVAARKAAGLCGGAIGDTIRFSRGAGEPDDHSTISIAMASWPRQQPFQSQDAVFVLGYSIIMLSTNIHNPNVRDKMALHEFISMNCGINAGDNFPGDFLADIYNDIANEELRVRT